MKERKDKMKDEAKGSIPFLLVLFILSAAVFALSVLCLNEMKSNWVQKNLLWCYAGVGVFVLFSFALSVVFIKTEKQAFAKGTLSLLVLLVFALAVCLVLQKTGFFEVVKTPERLKEYLERAGAWMPVSYVLLQFLQVVILPIPSIVSTVAGVALFGAFRTTVYSLIGILAGSILAFWISRKWGNRAVSWTVGEETLQKWQKKLKGKDNLFLTLMFVLPLFPDDILCFLAGLSSMSTRYFLIVILLSRLLAITATCYSFDFIPFNTWWGLTLWGIFILAITVTFVLVYKNMDKIQKLFKRKRNK